MNYQQLTALPKPYLYNAKYPVGHATITTTSPLLISVPHAVSQTRLGHPKAREIGSAKFALALQQMLNANLIIKTQNHFDDANFDLDCPYRQTMNTIITQQNITHLIDVHGLASTRPCDVNLGINLGDNIAPQPQLLDQLVNTLTAKGFTVKIDQPFCGRYPAIAADFHQRFNLWTLQVEINCTLTNNSANVKKFNALLDVFRTVFATPNLTKLPQTL